MGMAPEMIDAPHAHSCMVDWWAVGVLTFELITSQVPFDGEDANNTLEELYSIRRAQEFGVPANLLPPGTTLAKDFMKQLLTSDEEARLGNKGVSQLVHHPWFTFNKFSWESLEARQLKSPYVPPLPVLGT